MSPSSIARRRRRWFPLAASLVGIAAGLALAELGAHLYYERYVAARALPLGPRFLELESGGLEIEVPDADLFWRYVPNLERVETLGGPPRLSTNRFGLRAPDFAVPKPEGVFRVLSLGESTTLGDFVLAEETYSARLEALLDARGDGWDHEVINGGHGSYTSFQSRRLLERHAAEWQPDLILTYHEYNDTLPTGHRHSENARLGLGYTDRELWRKLAGEPVGLRARLRESLLRRSWFFWLIHLGALDRERVPPDDLRDNYEAFEDIATRVGAGLVVLHPVVARFQPHGCVLTRFAAERGVPLVELSEAWRASGLDAGEMFVDGVHPTPAGHAVIARAVYAALSSDDLLPAPRRARAPRPRGRARPPAAGTRRRAEADGPRPRAPRAP